MNEGGSGRGDHGWQCLGGGDRPGRCGGCDRRRKTGLVDRWRDLGPTVWIVAATLGLGWLALLALLAAVNDPRRVRPEPVVLEAQGPEPPAVVNLLTTDWRLTHAAIPATLVDLAARRHLELDRTGDRTFVRLRRRRGPSPPAGERPGDGDLTFYEQMVLDHLGGLARATDDGRIPAEALTTGPETQAKGWWALFRSRVVDDARTRGLSQPRWSKRAKATLVLAAAPVALAVGLAVSTLPDNPNDDDDNPVTAGLVFGGATFGGLAVAAGKLSGRT